MERRHVRFLSLLISLLVLVSLCATTVFAEEITISEDPKCYLHGDVNGDGEIGSQDAIYALYYAMWHDVDASLYPVVNQGFDFTGEGKVSAKDALYLLWASYNTDGYELKGELHEHYVPYWTWDTTGATPTATLTVRCGCGQAVELNAEVTSVTTEATCVAAGKVEYTAKVTYLDKEYVTEDPYVVDIPVSETGHDFGGAVRDCENGVTCINAGCDTDLTDDVVTPYSLPALGHVLVLDEENSTAATCTAKGQQVYHCTNEGCEKSHTVEQEMLSHHYEYVEGGDHLVARTTCTYVKTYKCSVGEEVVDGTAAEDIYTKHVYTAAMTTEPNCQEKGVKTYTCSVENCGASYTEDVEPNGVHHWNEGVTAGNITTYTCTIDGCGETKTSVVPDTDGTITKEALSSATELKVGDDNTSVALGSEALSDLKAEDKVEISVAKVTDLSGTNLNAEELAQVDGDAVYNFSLKVNGEPQSEFGGEITVTIPYTLQPGDDIDSIDIWYIDDNGDLAPKPMKGAYCNGYVTFKTTHFSYYTVTRLTPAERCARYGHIWVKSDKPATCTEGGYKMSVCQRCGAVDEDNKTIIAPLGHDYVNGSNAKDATCTEPGRVHKFCQRTDCYHTVEEEIPAMGHNMVKDENKSVDNSCYNAGVLVMYCTNDGCGLEVVEDLPQKQHRFEDGKIETEHATCNSSGKKHKTCLECREKIKVEDIAPLGHDYVVAENGWHWNEDRTSATVDLICKNNEKHTQTRKAVVKLDEEKSNPATCTTGGYLVYTATSTFNRLTFTDSITMEQSATGHKTSGEWKNTADEHYRFCETCGQRADSDEHKWGDINVIKEPTCKDSGTATASCVICGYSVTETIPSTGQHDLVNGKCSVCGFTENSCNHLKLRSTLEEVEGYGICDGLVLEHSSCECGEVGVVYIWDSGCDFEHSWHEENDVYTEQMVCKDCGLTYEYQSTTVCDEANCTAYFVTRRKVFVGETLLAETYQPETEMIHSHPQRVKGETIDLTEYGLCGGTATKYTCFCGETSGYQIDLICNENPCQTCGAEREGTYTREKQGCQMRHIESTFFKINGKTVLTLESLYIEMYHNEVVTEFEMEGTSCVDGVLAHSVCEDCGKERDRYIYDYHWPAVRVELIDLSGTGSCAPVISKYTCFCGEYEEWFEGRSMGDQGYHNWTPVSVTEDNTVEFCADCNFTRTIKRTSGAKDANCESLRTFVVTYADDKGHTYSLETKYPEVSHDYKTTYELKGTSCEDGVKRRETCNDCGHSYISWEFSDHNADEINAYHLAEYGLCGDPKIMEYSCPCGQESWTYRSGFQCDWRGVNDEHGHDYTCVNCGVNEKYVEEVLATIDGCHDRVRTTYTYSKDNQELVKIQKTTIRETHRHVVTYSLNDQTQGCNGGYTLTWKCLDCGETHEEGTNYHHETRPIARQIASVNQLCGDLEIVTWSCACGRDTYVGTEWQNGHCEFQWTDYDNKRDCTIYTCVKCGALREEFEERTPIAGETCKEKTKVTFVFSKNGKEAGSYSYENVTYAHEERFTYTLLGTTCDDGYTYSCKCAKCDTVLKESSDVHYGCNTRPVKTLLYVEHEDICSRVELYEAACACGAIKEIHNGWNCRMEHMGWDEINDCGIYQCMDCGLKWYDHTEQEHIDGTCTANQTYDWKFELNGEIIGSYKGAHVVTEHKYLFNFSLNGQTCGDGWTATKTCVYCNKTGTEQDSGHWYELIQYYDLSKYGLCGGSQEVYGCACGEISGWGGEDFCDWHYTGKSDPVTGADEYYCAKCGTYRYEGETGQRDPATCTYKGVRFIKFVRGGQTLLEINRAFEHDAHDVRIVSSTLLNPSEGCEGGVQVVEKCADCAYSYENTYSHHRTYKVHSIDLSNGCGGKLEFYECVCGQDKHFSQEWECKNMTHTNWQEYDADGVYHQFSLESCKACGLMIENEWYDIHDEDSCDVVQYDNYAVTYNGQTYHHNRINEWQSHDTRYTKATLLDGKTNCEEGVIVEWICRDCGATGSNHQRDHALVSVESIDLAPYGAICGGYLDKFTCACGERMRYDFATESECDPGHQWTSHWIPNVLNVSQETTQGYMGTYSDAWIVKCAVSDPDPCGLSIRVAEYWLNENCVAVEYQTWQLGYDETTGQFQKEITIATGEKHAYHPYVQSSINETLADGSEVGGERWDCPDCGSYYYHKHTRLNGVQTKYEELYVNTRSAVNGEPKQRSYDSVFGLIANGFSYETSNRQERIDADGSVWWEEATYTNYDFSNNDCRRTRTWKNSYGDGNVYEEGAHMTNCKDYNSLEPTCTQHGEHVHAHVCVVCQNVADESRSKLNPTGHNFDWDDEKQTYVCRVCELESIRGVMGAIYLEDMTEDADSVYTIGYWNRDDISFNPYVSVILDDAADDDKEFVLTGITFDYLNVKEDGVRALTFDKAAAQAAADQLVADRNYSGSYAIRISFVPTSGDNTLDYAITFDSQNTAQ